MDAKTENSNEDEQQAEQERIAAAAAVAADARIMQQHQQDRIDSGALSRRRLGLIVTVLKGCDEFPFRTKNKTNELVENVFGTDPRVAHHQQQHEELHQADDEFIDQRNKRRRLNLINTLEGMREYFPDSPMHTYIEGLCDPSRTLVRTFLRKLKKDVHDMLCENNTDNPDSDTIYCGLDSTRDTEEEVEAILRIFPDVLTEREQLGDYHDDYHDRYVYYYCPIQFLAFNLKAVSFLPLVARLSIELDLFEEQYRGGLLVTDAYGEDPHNPLQNLLSSVDRFERDDNDDNYNQEHHEDQYLQVLIKLRRMDLLKKEDIQNFDLLLHLCRRPYFSKKTYRFLIEWDLNTLFQTNEYGQSPLNRAAIVSCTLSIQVFQFVFEAGIRYFPKMKGIHLLFRKNREDYYTPFQYTCQKFGKEQVMKVIDDTLGYYSGDTPINTTEALVMAAIDENIHLDCVYFLLRRKPDVLQKLLLSSASPTAMAMSMSMATVMDKNNISIVDKNNDNDSGNNDTLGGQTKTNTKKKRKRLL